MMLNEYLFTNRALLKKSETYFWFTVKWTYWLLVLIGLLCILIARGHYMVDIVLAYFITSHIFYLYHGLCSFELNNKNQTKYALQRLWWYKLFLFVESDTIENKITVDNSFDSPNIKLCWKAKPKH